MSYDVIFWIESEGELINIIDYIAQDSESRAIQFSSKLYADIYKNLSFMPSMFRIYEKNIRIFPYWHYVIFYEINEERGQVEILHIIHGARDLAELDF